MRVRVSLLRAFCVAAMTAPLLVTARAHAEPAAPAADRALATDLFNQARALVADGRVAEACPMFAESQRLDPGPGTLLNLANCHESLGLTATAWAEFNEALAVAERERQPDRVAFAEAHIASLAQRLSRLVVVVPPELAGRDLVVTRDGSSVASVALGSAMPVDPGMHHIEVRGRGFLPWSAEVDVADGARREVVIGPLVADAESAPVAASVPLAAPPATDAARNGAATDQGASRGRVAALVSGGVGVVALGVGTVFGVLAITRTSRSDSLCAPRCNDEGYALNHDAKTAADVATVSFAIGAAALGASVVLFLTSKPAEPAARAPVKQGWSVGAAGAALRF